MRVSLILALVTFLSFSFWAIAQTPDPALLAEIQKIKAIDNHSHPPKLVAAGETDGEHDALPCGPLEPTDNTMAGRPENPQYLAAWKALWGYKYDDAKPEHLATLMETKARIKREQGDNYLDWVLDQLGIEIELANRVAMGRGLHPSHFRWVPFDDALMLPLNNDSVASETPDRKFFYGREEWFLKRYMKELGVNKLPDTLSGFTSEVVTPELEAQKKAGAVAVKFEAAYLRALNFQPAAEPEASGIYGRYVRGGVPSKAENLKLQDYLFHYIAREAGRLGLPVHLHTGGGCGGYFMLGGSAPTQLDAVINDASLRQTKFVMVHGGAGSYTKEMAYQFIKPNVYADFSEQTWLESPRKLADTLRTWMEWYPEKVMFGTDLYPDKGAYDWEEIGWQTTQTGREALAIALTGMMQDGEITREQALKLAHMVLHDTAAKLYGWEH